MKDIVRRLALTALTGAVAALAAAPLPARAAFDLRFQEDSKTPLMIHYGGSLPSGITGSITSTTVGGVEKIILSNVQYGDFTIDGTLARSNTPGASSEAFVSLNNMGITNTDKVNAHTLAMSTSADFTQPLGPTPTTLTSTASGDLVQGGHTASGNFTSYLGTSLFDLTGTHAPAIPFNLTGPTNSFSGNTSVQLFTMPSPFTLTGVGTYTVGACNTLDVTGGGSTLSTPGPGGLVLALTALPLCLGGCWRRFRARPA
jgi:hypothetical protein